MEFYVFHILGIIIIWFQYMVPILWYHFFIGNFIMNFLIPSDELHFSEGLNPLKKPPTRTHAPWLDIPRVFGMVMRSKNLTKCFWVASSHKWGFPYINGGTPKWMVYNGNPIEMDDLGVPLF